MTEYEEFLEEKKKIDNYFREDYKVHNVYENLSGMFIEFTSIDDSFEQEVVQLQLVTSEARKYISTLLMINQ